MEYFKRDRERPVNFFKEDHDQSSFRRVLSINSRKMFKFISVIVIQAVFALTIQGSDSDKVCLPTWRRKEGIHSIGATEVTDSMNVNSLTKCLIYCQSTVGCLAVDFNHLGNSCWMHFDPAYNLSESVYEDDPTVSQYSLENCVSFNVSKKGCPSSWHTSANKSSSSSYAGIGLANFSSCFSYCRFTDSCNGIAFDNSSWPFCKVFSSFDFADPHNLIENPSSTIYLFDKKECLANPSNKSYARCIGETFPQVSQWCPEGSNVTITSLRYRDNPFCCKDVLQQNIYPLDNNQLATFFLDYFAKSYSDSIRNCILNRSCILRAELNVSIAATSVCLTDEKAPNSVSISFTCSSKPQIDTATNLSTSTLLLPLSSSLPVYTLDPEVPSETTFPSLTQPPSTLSSANAHSLPSFTSSTAILSNATSSSLASSSSSSPAVDTTSSSSASPTSTFPLPTDAVSSPSSSSAVIPNTISLSLSSSSPAIDMTSATFPGYFQNVTLSPSASPTSTFPLPTDALSSPSSSSAVIPNTMSSSSYEVKSSPAIYTASVTHVTLSNFAKNVSSQYTASSEPTVSLPPTNATISTTSKSPEKTNDPSTSPPSANNENEENRTALILGALGTTFGLLSLLLLVLLVVLFCRNLRDNGSDMFDTFSWKNIIHGSSSV